MRLEVTTYDQIAATIFRCCLSAFVVSDMGLELQIPTAEEEVHTEEQRCLARCWLQTFSSTRVNVNIW